MLLITDGLDRDAGAGLAHEMDRLHRSCRRLIWLNPLLRYEGFEPRSLGMKAMMPHVDEFRPVHNLESLETLIEVLSAPATRRGHGGRAWQREPGEGSMSDTAEILRTGSALARGRVGRGVGHRRHHVGLLAAAGRRQARGQRCGRHGRLGLGRLRRGRGCRTRRSKRSATASRGCSISASPTTRPGKSASPAAARSRSLSSASNERAHSRPRWWRRSASTAASLSQPISRPAGNCCSRGAVPRVIWRSTMRRSTAVREAWRTGRNRTIETCSRPRVRRGAHARRIAASSSAPCISPSRWRGC